MTENEGEAGAGGVDYYNRRLEKGLASSNIKHRFINVLSYELPFGQGRKWMKAGSAMSFWWMGTGLDPDAAVGSRVYGRNVGSQPLSSDPAQRPDIVTTYDQAQVQDWEMGPNRFPTSAQNPYLNFSSFAYPAAFNVGNLGRNTFIGPGLNSTSFPVEVMDLP